ncbi:hypothetical protein [Ureaplasma ceti]|uniref:Uncharacterized protein n=1 Tax=Ureaplasma ceti TaxID=3119530 RepID=A0ABP9UAL2_9BACT
MSTNYAIMKQSEKELLNTFDTYLKDVLNIHNNLYAFLISQEQEQVKHLMNDEQYAKFEYSVEKASKNYEDILDETMWMIQKNEPRASHLRFIISVIDSIKDVDRISSYVEILTNFFYKREVPDKVFNMFIDGYKQTNDLLMLIYNEFVEKSIEECREDISDSIREYHIYLKNKIRSCVLLFNDADLSIQNKTLIDLITCFGVLERMVEHVDNIIKAFYYIR